MGVVPYVLKGRARRDILIGPHHVAVGLVERRPYKLTEETIERRAGRAALEAAAGLAPSPRAVLVPGRYLGLRAIDGGLPDGLVIGWDRGRTSVTDHYWDHLPVLGYVVPNPGGLLVLHDQRPADGDLLVPVDAEQAVQRGYLNQAGRLQRLGQPRVTSCRNVRRFHDGWAVADCDLESGRREDLYLNIGSKEPPVPAWLVGKTPREIQAYGGAGSE